MVCEEYLRGPSKRMRDDSQRDIDCIEKEKFFLFWPFYEKYSPEQILYQFKTKTSDTKTWDLIPYEQYRNLLKRFMEDPIGARIPDNIVTNWILIICKNLAQILSIQKLWGRCTKFPFADVEKFYNINKIKDLERYRINCMNELHHSGFYKWARTPEGNEAFNDCGFKAVYDILKKYREDMEPENKLMLIDRCLNVVHGRGPMAEYFIEGGKKSLDKIRDL